MTDDLREGMPEHLLRIAVTAAHDTAQLIYESSDTSDSDDVGMKRIVQRLEEVLEELNRRSTKPISNPQVSMPSSVPTAPRPRPVQPSQPLRGPRTQEYDFYIPILQALVQLGGEAPARQVLQMVEQRMMDEFTPADLQPIASSPDYPRWDKTANWARQELAELGYIVRPGRHGIWEISESGRAWLSGQLGQGSSAPPEADAAPTGETERS